MTRLLTSRAWKPALGESSFPGYWPENEINAVGVE
jgi:hypothetical protein